MRIHSDRNSFPGRLREELEFIEPEVRWTQELQHWFDGVVNYLATAVGRTHKEDRWDALQAHGRRVATELHAQNTAVLHAAQDLEAALRRHREYLAFLPQAPLTPHLDDVAAALDPAEVDRLDRFLFREVPAALRVCAPGEHFMDGLDDLIRGYASLVDASNSARRETPRRSPGAPAKFEYRLLAHWISNLLTEHRVPLTTRKNDALVRLMHVTLQEVDRVLVRPIRKRRSLPRHLKRWLADSEWVAGSGTREELVAPDGTLTAEDVISTLVQKFRSPTGIAAPKRTGRKPRRARSRHSPEPARRIRKKTTRASASSRARASSTSRARSDRSQRHQRRR